MEGSPLRQSSLSHALISVPHMSRTPPDAMLDVLASALHHEPMRQTFATQAEHQEIILVQMAKVDTKGCDPFISTKGRSWSIARAISCDGGLANFHDKTGSPWPADFGEVFRRLFFTSPCPKPVVGEWAPAK